MRSSISSDRARSFTFRTVGAYYSNVMQAVWPRLALRSYGEGANMANMALPVAGSRVNPFPVPGRPPARPSGPSILAAAAEGAPGVARTRPRAPRDLKSKRKKLLSGLKSRKGRPRPQRPCL